MSQKPAFPLALAGFLLLALAGSAWAGAPSTPATAASPAPAAATAPAEVPAPPASMQPTALPSFLQHALPASSACCDQAYQDCFYSCELCPIKTFSCNDSTCQYRCWCDWQPWCA